MTQSSEHISPTNYLEKVMMIKKKAEYIGSFLVSGKGHYERAEIVREKLETAKKYTHSKPIILLISLNGIKVCRDNEHIYMAHALRRISYATCDPENLQFAFLAREPKAQPNIQYCHAFVTTTSEEAEELNSIVGEAFRLAYTRQRNTVVDSQTSVENSAADKSVHAPCSEKYVKVKQSSNDIQNSPQHQNVGNNHENQQSIDEQLEKLTPITQSDSNNQQEQLLEEPNHVENQQPRIQKQIKHKKHHKNCRKHESESNELIQMKNGNNTSIDLSNLPQHSTETDQPLAPPPSSHRLPESSSRPDNLPAASPIRPLSQHFYDIADHLAPLAIPILPPKQGLSSRSVAGDKPTTISSSSLIPPPSFADDDINNSPSQPLYTNTTIGRCQAELAQCPWYRPELPRQVVLNYLAQQPSGSFLVRDSASHADCYALSMRVSGKRASNDLSSRPSSVIATAASPVPHHRPVGATPWLVNPQRNSIAGYPLPGSHSQSSSDSIISHFLIEQMPNGGVKLKGLDKQWPSLSCLIVHLTVLPEMLPCPLRMEQSTSRSNPAAFDSPPECGGNEDGPGRQLEVNPFQAPTDYQRLSDFSCFASPQPTS